MEAIERQAEHMPWGTPDEVAQSLIDDADRTGANSVIVNLNRGAMPVAPYVWGTSLFGVLLYVIRGWALSGVGAYGLIDLLWAPGYVIWKLTLRLKEKGRSQEEWIRTTREVGM